MSEEEKFKSTIQEIKEVFLFLTEQEPTPDDEIEAREKLIDKFRLLEANKEIFPNLNNLIENTLHKLENWDTLDYWFVEVDGLSDNIQKIINLSEKEAEPEVVELQEVEEIKTEVKTEAPQIDIGQIVAQVSEQFKGEIGGLKDQIELLKKELEKKDKALKTVTQPKAKKVQKPAPKTGSKLAPPEIKIPTIKKPSKPPRIKPKLKPKVEIPKEAKKIKPVKIEPIKVEEKVEKPKIEPVSVEEPKIEPVSIEKPKIEPVSIERPKLEPISVEKPKIEPVSEEKLKIEPVSEEKPKIEPVSEEKPKIEPVSEEKPKIIPFAVEKPTISPVKVEAVESDSIKSSSTDLFNIFSPPSESKKSQTSVRTVEPLEKTLTKGKKKRGDKKRKRGEKPGDAGQASSWGFGPPEGEVDSGGDFGASGVDAMPADKDSLYQELIALEGRRYSLEKGFKEIEKGYQKGTIDDFEYKSKSDELKYKLSEISSRINNIRRVISGI